MQIVAANHAESYNLHILKIQNGRRPTYWKSKIHNLSTTVKPIATKFCRKMQVAAVNLVVNLVKSLKNCNFIAMFDYYHDMLSVYLTVLTRVYCDKTAEIRIMQFLLKCSPMY